MIKLLPQDLINKIAAGEVVDRPASVVKELTENAIDAGVKKLDIVLEEGGIRLIQITDNGSGMNEDDARLCLLRHATSKLSTADDLFNIQTLGFRGEALATIAAVSQFSLLTKQNDSSGWRVWLDAKHQPVVEAAAANDGTKIIVQNLFYNVPARQKFLKTAATEFTHILRYLQQFALIHPEVEIRLEHNGKVVFHYLVSAWEKRVQDILGSLFVSRSIPISYHSEELSISGYTAKPELIHATHKNQYLFVNGRPVYDSLISRSVLEAYQTMIPRGYFPAFVLNIQIDPSEVDVNVHPRKTEIKFLNPGKVISSLQTSIKQSLSDSDLTADHSIPKYALPPILQQQSSYKTSLSFDQSASRPNPNHPKQSLNFSQDLGKSLREIKKTPLEERGWNILGQIYHSFILAETAQGLQLFDQHAVSEIVNYSRLRRQHEDGEVCSQRLLIPVTSEVTSEEKNIAEESREIFERLGWEFDELTSTNYQLTAIPEVLKVEHIREHFLELLNQLKDEKSLDMTGRELALIKFEACRSSVMFGDALTLEEMKGLLNKWLGVENNNACEHGRPAVARIGIDEMKKFFRR
jgi:DNA mismatch repair protein MutL